MCFEVIIETLRWQERNNYKMSQPKHLNSGTFQKTFQKLMLMNYEKCLQNGIYLITTGNRYNEIY